MTLLIDVGHSDWMRNEDLRDRLATLIPGADIRCAGEPGDPADVVMIAVAGSRPGQFTAFPNLALVQKLGAGVETIVFDPTLPPGVRVARLKPDAPAREIAEYALTYVLAALRDVVFYHDRQVEGRWKPVAPRSSADATVGVLGLGHIGARVARSFALLDFGVHGWSRSRKSVDGVACHHGMGALAEVLGASDFLIAVLPSTPDTRGLMDAVRFAQMKPRSTLINVGRGDLVDEADLIAALDSGHLAGAVLDVFRSEPLPPESPLWLQPGVTITPHVSGWHIGDGLADVAENYRRLRDGDPLLHEVDRTLGY